VGSTPTQSTFIILVEYGIVSSSIDKLSDRQSQTAGVEEEELQGTHYRASNLCSKVPSSHVVAALMLLPLLLSLQPRPQQHNSDNHTTTTAPLYAIVAEIVISSIAIIILPLALLEMTRPFFLMVHFLL
jgi:hypothetical protein